MSDGQDVGPVGRRWGGSRDYALLRSAVATALRTETEHSMGSGRPMNQQPVDSDSAGGGASVLHPSVAATGGQMAGRMHRLHSTRSDGGPGQSQIDKQQWEYVYFWVHSED